VRDKWATGLVYSSSFPDPRGHRPVAWVLQLPRSTGWWANSVLVGKQTPRTCCFCKTEAFWPFC